MIDIGWLKRIKTKKVISLGIVSPLILLGLFICFYKLGYSALENWDEAWYADVVRAMLRTKEFFVMYWNQAVYLDKPPLYMWLTSFVVKGFGLTEFTFRFVSALSGITVILLVLFNAYRLYGIIPAMIAFSTLAFNNIFIWRVRSGNLDALLTLLFVLGYFLMISKKKYRYVLLGIVFGLMYLTKLTEVLFPMGTFVLTELLYENKKIIPNLSRYIKIALICILIAGAWLYFGSIKAGPEFAKYFLYRADQGVSTVTLSNAKMDYLQYAYYSLQRRFTWLVILGLGYALLKLKEKRYFIQIILAIGLLIQLSFTIRNNNWYLMPAIPFWSLLAALSTSELLKLFKKIKFGYIFIILFILVSFYISYKTFKVNIMTVINSAGPVKLKESSLKIRSLSKRNDIVVRLDHLYPSTIYYTDRKVFSSPDGVGSTDLFISREDLKHRIETKEIKWVVGVNGDVESFLKDQDKSRFKIIKVNDEETILQVI